MRKPWVWLFLIALTAAPVRPQGAGAVEPGAVQQQSNVTQKYYGLQDQVQEPKEPLKPGETVIDNTAPASNQPLPGGGPTFELRGVETNPSAILTPAELQQVTGRYENRNVNIGDLRKMVEEINDLYKQKGYITARAFLPPQSIDQGVVHVDLVEGRVGQVEVTGNAHTVPGYYTRRVGLSPGDLVDTGPLEKSMVRFNQTSDTRLRAVLAAGSEFGTTNVDLEAVEPKNITTTLSADTAGYNLVGRNRIGLTVVDRSLFGHRDALTVGTYWASGTVATNIQYEVPVGTSGAYISSSVNRNQISYRSGALSQLGVTGHFWNYSINYRRPVFVTRRTLLEVYAGPNYQRSILQSPSLQIRNAWISYMRFGNTLRRYDQNGLLQWDNSFSAGEQHVTGSYGFLKYNGNLTRMRNLPGGLVAVFRAMGQVRLAGGGVRLPAAQQFQLGGISTVRGYPLGTLIGDNGYMVSSELDTPLPFARANMFDNALARRLKLAFFLEHGAVMQSGNHSFLTGVGGGFILNFSRSLTGRVNLAVPLQNRANIKHLDFEFYLQTVPPWEKLFHRN